jgi:hypothetical protein
MVRRGVGAQEETNPPLVLAPAAPRRPERSARTPGPSPATSPASAASATRVNAAALATCSARPRDPARGVLLALVALTTALGSPGTANTRSLAASAAHASTITANPDTVLVSEHLTWHQTTLVASPETAKRYAKLLRLTSDEQIASDAVVDAALHQMREAMNRCHRAMRNATSEEETRSTITIAKRSIQQAERVMLDDLRAIAGPRRAEEFAAFERWHRLSLHSITFDVFYRSFRVRLPVRVLASLLEDARLTPGVSADLGPAIDRYERELDALLISLARSHAKLEELRDLTRSIRDLSDEQLEAMRALRHENTRLMTAISRLDLSVIRAAVRAVPDAQQDAFIRRALTSVLPDPSVFGAICQESRQWAVVCEVLALPLSEQQTAKINSLISEAEATRRAAARKLFDAVFAVDSSEDAQNEMVWRAFDNARTLMKRERTSLDAAMRAVLTPDQLRQLDVSPVLSDDPDESPKSKRSDPDDFTP